MQNENIFCVCKSQFFATYRTFIKIKRRFGEHPVSKQSNVQMLVNILEAIDTRVRCTKIKRK